ncbi:MAG: alpha/beta hydrolase [Prolixibacteraceae bacterium]|jgi:hypothetical protein
MYFNKRSFFSATILFLFLSQAIGLSLSAQNNTPECGIYDGNIGHDQIVLVAETNNSGMLKGYFVLNRGKAVEESHAFSMHTEGSHRFFQSDLYLGKIKSGKQNNSSFEASMLLLNKRSFFFFRKKANMNFIRRNEPVVSPTERYQNQIFSDVEVKSNVLYGKAKGLWTSSPYSNDPYIETLRKGMIKTFKDPSLLDLYMDIYYPKTDVFKNRPLVMLIHGGAFYIGSKESIAERTLATSLAKCGYLVASIDYRLGFKLLPSDLELSAYRAVQDAHAALRFLAHNAKGLGIDPDQVYVGGTSAGAVASLSVAFMDKDERPKGIIEAEKEGLVSGIEASGNKYTEKFTIKSVANMWGAVANLNILGKDDSISVLSIHGTADGIVPYEYDHPFQNSLMVNRLLMDKMYGSKPIHDRLQMLGKRNLLVSLEGLGHEPELERFDKLNQYMDTITNHVTHFFYEETAPTVMLPPSQLTVPENSPLKSIYYEVNNGKPVRIEVSGGVKAIADPTDATIIWFKNSEKRQLSILTTNKFEAWNLKSFPVNVGK